MPQDALGQLKHLKTARARWSFPDVRTKDFLAQHLQGLSHILVGHSMENVTSLSEIVDFRAKT